MAAINDYMKQRYMTSPYLRKAILSGLEGKVIPKTRQQAADNIEATIAMASLLVGVKIIDQIERAQVAMLESRCIMAGMRRETYDDAQVQSRTEMLRITPLRASTPIGGMGIGIARIAENKPEPDARQALQNLSLSMQKVQSGSEAAERRDIFLQ